MGIEINDKYIHSLLFADGQVIIGQDREDVEFMTHKLADTLEEGGLNINYDKTEYVTVGEEGKDLHINDKTIRRVEHFKYLGSEAIQDG